MLALNLWNSFRNGIDSLKIPGESGKTQCSASHETMATSFIFKI